MTNDPKLLITQIQRFSLHDGPGIRTTVFLKGCPLRCPWCANPETQHMARERMYFENLCIRCGACVPACGSGALSWKDGAPLFRREKCTGCGACRDACPYGAIEFSGEWRTPESILREVLRDKDYYEATGGGLTVSGGEPFMQPEGLMALLLFARRAGLHTAVETCGQSSPERFEASFEYADLFLFDVKHTDAASLRRVTGGEWKLILGNLERAVKSGREVIVRIPVIPGFNSDADTVRDILKLAAGLGVSQVHLLPYHELGSNKYKQLGLAYPWARTGALGKEALIPFVQYAQELGLNTNFRYSCVVAAGLFAQGGVALRSM